MHHSLSVYAITRRLSWTSAVELRSAQTPLMPGSSAVACSIMPMPLRTMRSEPSAWIPEHVTTCAPPARAGEHANRADAVAHDAQRAVRLDPQAARTRCSARARARMVEAACEMMVTLHSLIPCRSVMCTCKC